MFTDLRVDHLLSWVIFGSDIGLNQVLKLLIACQWSLLINSVFLMFAIIRLIHVSISVPIVDPVLLRKICTSLEYVVLSRPNLDQLINHHLWQGLLWTGQLLVPLHEHLLDMTTLLVQPLDSLLGLLHRDLLLLLYLFTFLLFLFRLFIIVLTLLLLSVLIEGVWAISVLLLLLRWSAIILIVKWEGGRRCVWDVGALGDPVHFDRGQHIIMVILCGLIVIVYSCVSNLYGWEIVLGVHGMFIVYYAQMAVLLAHITWWTLVVLSIVCCS